jgi:hypothetical protein
MLIMATDKTTPAASAPVAPQPNQLTPLHSAWSELRARLDAAPSAPVNQSRDLGAIGRWLEQEAEAMEPLLGEIAAVLAPPQAAKLLEDHALVARGAQAGKFVNGQLEIFREAKAASQRRSSSALVKEASGLQHQGHEHLTLLVMTGKIEEAEAKVIRRGRGALDAAQDCQRMGLLFDEHWDDIEPLIARVSFKDTPALTPTHIKRMKEVGDALVNELSRDAADFRDTTGVDWSHHRSALIALLHAAWEPLRYAALYHASLSGQDNPRLVPLGSMRATSSLYR